MPTYTTLLLALATAYVTALIYGVALRSVRSSILTACVIAAILACPLLIPANEVILRALASLFSADLTFKVADLQRITKVTHVVPRASDICQYLIPFPFLLVVYQQKQRHLPTPDRDPKNTTQMCGAFLVGTAAIGLLYASWFLSLAASSFFLDHTVKVLIFVVFLEAFSRWLYRIERFVGYDTVPIINNLFKAQTVSEFWRRYNTRVHSWFYLDLFRPALRFSPAYAVVLVFSVNGLLHELMFGITTSRFDGYQLMFFLVQIPAVLSSRWLRRFACRNGLFGVTLVHSFTIAWMLITSMLFFHGVNRIVPFYSATPWLP